MRTFSPSLILVTVSFTIFVVVGELECEFDNELLRDETSSCRYKHCSHGVAVTRTCPEGIGVSPLFERSFTNPCVVQDDDCDAPKAPGETTRVSALVNCDHLKFS